MEAITAHFEAALSGSPLYAFLLVYLAGVLTSLTPCVLPLFPVAVGTITASARRQEFIDGRLVETVTSRTRAFAMGLAYALGIASMYSLLGLLAALSGKAVFGIIASSPLAYLVIGVLMLLLALWLWKGDRLDFSAWLQNWAYAGGEAAGPVRRALRWYTGHQGGGAAATFSFGFISGILAGPCTAPVIAMVLAHIAKAGEIVYGVGLMFIFAIGLATLMVIAGMSASLAVRLRGQGRLAQTVKVGFILLMLGMTGFYFYKAADFGGLIKGGGTPAAAMYRIVEVSKEGADPVKALEVGAQLPDFTYEELPREEAKAAPAAPKPARRRFSEWRGQVVILPFWATWCTACLAEIPEVNRLAEKYRGSEKVTVLSIDGLDDPEKARRDAGKRKINYPVILDEESLFTDRIGATTFPLNMVIAPDGRVAYSATTLPKDMEALVTKLLNAK